MAPTVTFSERRKVYIRDIAANATPWEASRPPGWRGWASPRNARLLGLVWLVLLVAAILTGLLVGVFLGIVALTTDVLPFSSPVAVAASTLAAAALFNPLRLQVQKLVDRRFNRARYDAEAIVTAFTLRLRDAVDLDTVRGELVRAVERAVEPTHVSVWIRPPG